MFENTKVDYKKTKEHLSSYFRGDYPDGASDVRSDMLRLTGDGVLHNIFGVGACRDKYQECAGKTISPAKIALVALKNGLQEKNVERFLGYLNELEDTYLFKSPTRIERVEYKTEWGNRSYYLIEGSSEWVTNGVLISLYTLLLRGILTTNFHNNKNIKDWRSFINYIKVYETHNPAVSRRYGNKLLVEYLLETFRDTDSVPKDYIKLLNTSEQQRYYGIHGFLSDLFDVLNESQLRRTEIWFSKSVTFRALAIPIIHALQDELQDEHFLQVYNKFPVFVYGTLKTGEVNNHVITRCGGTLLGQGRINRYGNFPFLINLTSSYPALVTGRGPGQVSTSYEGYRECVVYGEFWAVANFDDLDHLEGHPDYYVRITLSGVNDYHIRSPRTSQWLMTSCITYKLNEKHVKDLANNSQLPKMFIPSGDWTGRRNK
jgi:gamma-glutamylcyclotransferase (GGCT)/AIG2-like uncharacterized protein YtfP